MRKNKTQFFGKSGHKKFSIDNSPQNQQSKSVYSYQFKKHKDFPIFQTKYGTTEFLPSKRFIRKKRIPQNFDPRAYITKQLNLQDIINLKQVYNFNQVFDTYDSTGMGVLLPNDIKLLMQQHGFNPSKVYQQQQKTVYQIMAQYDQEEAGGISFPQFLSAMQSKPHMTQRKKDIKSIFKKYDKKGKGFIDLEDMKEINRHVKENLDEQTLIELFKRADSNNDGMIEFQDFYTVMTRQIEL